MQEIKKYEMRGGEVVKSRNVYAVK